MVERKEDPVQSQNDVASTNPTAAKFTIPYFAPNPDAPKPARLPGTKLSVAIYIGDPERHGEEVRLSAFQVLERGPDSGDLAEEEV